MSICSPKEIRSFTDVDFKPFFFFFSGTECFPSVNGSRLVQLHSVHLHRPAYPRVPPALPADRTSVDSLLDDDDDDVRLR